MDNMKHRRLQELDHSDFEIVDGEPDIRGWDVKNAQDQKIGEVEDLIVDAKMKKVRYMVVDLDDNDLDLDHHKVLIPIGMAELHQKEDDVVLPRIQVEQLRALPDYEKDQLDATAERQVCSALGRQGDTMKALEGNEHAPEFYRHDYFNDDNLYKNRLHLVKSKHNESEYDRGLKLWERRSEGGLLSDLEADRNIGRSGGLGRDESLRDREMEEERRLELVRNRRNNYQQRRLNEDMDRNRSSNEDRPYRRDNTIEGRIRDEGLQDG